MRRTLNGLSLSHDFCRPERVHIFHRWHRIWRPKDSATGFCGHGCKSLKPRRSCGGMLPTRHLSSRGCHRRTRSDGLQRRAQGCGRKRTSFPRRATLSRRCCRNRIPRGEYPKQGLKKMKTGDSSAKRLDGSEGHRKMFRVLSPSRRLFASAGKLTVCGRPAIRPAIENQNDGEDGAESDSGSSAIAP